MKYLHLCRVNLKWVLSINFIIIDKSCHLENIFYNVTKLFDKII